MGTFPPDVAHQRPTSLCSSTFNAWPQVCRSFRSATSVWFNRKNCHASMIYITLRFAVLQDSEPKNAGTNALLRTEMPCGFRIRCGNRNHLGPSPRRDIPGETSPPSSVDGGVCYFLKTQQALF